LRARRKTVPGEIYWGNKGYERKAKKIFTPQEEFYG
jgi:hypothetical protein